MIKTTNMKKVLFLLVSVLFVLGGYAQNLPIDDMRLAGGVSPTFTTNVTLRLYFHRNIHKLNL